jgi:acetate kinase
MSIVVFNAGSSTLKFALFDAGANTSLASGVIESTDQRKAVAEAIKQLSEPMGREPITVAGHRIVHGGSQFQESVRIDERVKAGIAKLAELAPLHNPPALDALALAEKALPAIPHVAVFDTAFFSRLPPAACIYPLLYEWYRQWGVRRFGFHGISHAYCADRAAQMVPKGSRLVICHLGNGCSASAVKDGRAIATTMGFTPMEGLMMGTRAGSVDPGLLLYLQRHRGLTVESLDLDLNLASGLLGVSGVSSDYRKVEAAAGKGNGRARLALEMFADRVRATIGAFTATLGGIDVLVFTAGIGEHSANLRATACAGLDCLGLRLDPERNASCHADADIAHQDSHARVLVIHTREELLIAREALRFGKRLRAGVNKKAR